MKKITWRMALQNLMVSTVVAATIAVALALGWDSWIAGVVAFTAAFLMCLDLTFNGSGMDDFMDDLNDRTDK